MLQNQAPSWEEIAADVLSSPASGSNVAPVKKEAATRPLRRAPTRVWNEIEVAKRALELYAFECDAAEAYRLVIARAAEFKERHDLERVDHKDAVFRAYTASKWTAYLDAKREEKLAKARLTTACRNVLLQREADRQMFAAD